MIPEHGGNKNAGLTPASVTDAVIRILQHLRNDVFHCAVAVFRNNNAYLWKQRLEEVVFPQLLIGSNRSPPVQLQRPSNRRAGGMSFKARLPDAGLAQPFQG
ncbi:hypothetical protein KCP73_07080 [Salmonella enterica subsp. enterica]|nr:hypothetical protein KCP73_07080 [Salmonella enterica subsp. enterica]